MRNLIQLLIVVAFIITISCCAKQLKEQEVTGPNGEKLIVDILTPKDAFKYVEHNRDNNNFVILDIRTPKEFREDRIEGAVNVDFRSSNFRGEIDKLDRNKTYFVYCRTGNRSRDAVNLMGAMGFRSLVRLAGDITGWKSAGLPIVK